MIKRMVLINFLVLLVYRIDTFLFVTDDNEVALHFSVSVFV